MDVPRPVTLLDGGTATELVRLGHGEIDSDPLWSARLLHTSPDVIRQAHSNFLEAGSRVVETATYQATLGGLTRHLGLDPQGARDLMTRGVELARQACRQFASKTGERCLVAGSMGPYGASLHDGSEYSGSYVEKLTVAELAGHHRDLLTSLTSSGADVIAMETLPAQKEAEAVVELLKEFPGTKAWVSFSCKDGVHVCHGERLADAVRSVMTSDHVIGVGVNCTNAALVSSLLAEMRSVTSSKLLLVKPNSGEGWQPDVGWQGRACDLDLGSLGVEWVAKGVDCVGGCCRFYPDDIRRLHEALAATPGIELSTSKLEAFLTS